MRCSQPRAYPRRQYPLRRDPRRSRVLWIQPPNGNNMSLWYILHFTSFHTFENRGNAYIHTASCVAYLRCFTLTLATHDRGEERVGWKFRNCAVQRASPRHANTMPVLNRSCRTARVCIYATHASCKRPGKPHCQWHLPLEGSTAEINNNRRGRRSGQKRNGFPLRLIRVERCGEASTAPS